MESYWKKFLVDKSIELGSDNLISHGLASWSRGRQDIVKVELFRSSTLISVSCPPRNNRIAKWMQFDSMIRNTRTGQTKRLARRIECKNIGYKFIVQYARTDLHGIVFEFCDVPPSVGVCSLIPSETSNVICEINDDGVSLRFEG